MSQRIAFRMGQPSQAPESVVIGKHCLQIAKPKHPLCYLKNYVLKQLQLLFFKSFYELNANPKVIPQVWWLKGIFYKHFPFLTIHLLRGLLLLMRHSPQNIKRMQKKSQTITVCIYQLSSFIYF